MEIVSFIAIVAACIAVGISLYALRLVPRPATEVDSVVGSSGECAKREHQWPKKPQLISDDIAVYWCRRGCGSELRQKVKKANG